LIGIYLNILNLDWWE